jgi:hypothetical protein
MKTLSGAFKTNYSLTRQAKLRLYNCCKQYAGNAVSTFISSSGIFLRLIEINF